MKNLVNKGFQALLKLLMVGGISYSANVFASQHSLLIAIDGLRGDGIENAHTPNIDALIQGNWSPGYSGAFAYYAQTLTDAAPNSGPNHVGIMTGVTAAKSGVTSNSNVGSGNYQTYPHYLSILEANNSALNTAYLVTWGTDMLITNNADVKIDSDDASNTQNAVDIVNESYSSATWPLGTSPDAIFLFLDDVDGAGHACCFNVADSGYKAEIEEVDGQIGQVLTAIKNRPNFANESWQIVITSDHGGRGSSHGIYAPDNYTIPFLVASKDVAQGYLSGIPNNYDAAPTVLAHHGIAVPSNMDGVVRGAQVQVLPPQNIADALVTYLPFTGNYQDNSGNGLNAQVGAGQPELLNNGKFGQYLAIDDNLGTGEYLTLGKPSAMDFATETDFTLLTWYRVSGDQVGDTVIVGNKDWHSGSNTGTLLLANEGNGDDVGINIASSSADRKDIDPIDYSFNDWWLLVASFDRDGVATLYAGDPQGNLHIIAGGIDDVGDITSTLNWNIGQDGTGSYAYNLTADLDDFAVWQRALSLAEVRTIYNQGAGVELKQLLSPSASPYLSINSDIQVNQSYPLAITSEAGNSRCGLTWQSKLRQGERDGQWLCPASGEPLVLTVSQVSTQGNEKIVSGYLAAQETGIGALVASESLNSSEYNAKFNNSVNGNLVTIHLVADENATTMTTVVNNQTCGFEWDSQIKGGKRNAKWDCYGNKDPLRLELLN